MKQIFAAFLFIILLASISFAAEPDLRGEFAGFDGAFVMVRLSDGAMTVYQEDKAQERLAPFSTFKVLNALIALETGVLESEQTVIPWNGQVSPIEAWNRDHTMASAVSESVVWYFQEVARRIGAERMQRHLDAVGYGNRDISGGIDRFWLSSSLLISDLEEMEFIRRLYREELPFSPRVMQTVKRVIVLEEKNGRILSGKTGSAASGKIGRFVGYVETGEDTYVFAVHICGERGAFGWKAKAVAKAVLGKLGVY